MKNDILNADVLKEKLKNIEIHYYSSIDSTNTQAKRLFNQGSKRRMLIVSDEQTAGRGRQGKSFFSPKSTGIYMSYVYHPMKDFKSAVSATTAASVAVCRAIENITPLRPEIKWVNDIYLNGKKICGILCEAITDNETKKISCVIIGIGVNIKTADFPQGIENASSLNADIKRADLIAEITKELSAVADSDFFEFIDYYKEHSMIIGKEIVFTKNGVSQNARAVEIENDGGLRVELENKEIITLRSGEISIRKRN